MGGLVLMKVCEKIFEKKFIHNISKEAYKKLFIWLAKNVILLQDEQELLLSIKKEKKASIPTFDLKIYCAADVDKVMDVQCEICRDTHRLSYMNNNYDCNKCKAKSFTKRIETQLEIKKTYWKGKIVNEKNME